MGTVTVTPQTFQYVEFDAATIAAIAEDVVRRVGLPENVDVNIEIDELVMLPSVTAELDGRRVTISVSGGSFEDNRKLRMFSPAKTGNVLAKRLLAARDRLDPAFGSPPPDRDMSIQEQAAWDTYSEGRAARLGLPARYKTRLYHFRLRHGFSDVIDGVFERLWRAEGLTWADLEAACAETAAERERLGIETGKAAAAKAPA